MENIQSDELTVNAPMSEMLTPEEISEYYGEGEFTSNPDFSFLGRRSIDDFNNSQEVDY